MFVHVDRLTDFHALSVANSIIQITAKLTRSKNSDSSKNQVDPTKIRLKTSLGFKKNKNKKQ